MEMKMCNCFKWDKSIIHIEGAITLAHVHGIEYQGYPFKYCPWCGKELIDTNSNSPLVTCWCGKPISELTHEELKSAFEELSKLYLDKEKDIDSVRRFFSA